MLAIGDGGEVGKRETIRLSTGGQSGVAQSVAERPRSHLGGVPIRTHSDDDGLGCGRRINFSIASGGSEALLGSNGGEQGEDLGIM